MQPFVHQSIVFWSYAALQCRSSMPSNSLVFHTSGGISSRPAAFLLLIFLYTESSSCLNCPSLMPNCSLIILVISSCVTFRGFPSKFSKCCCRVGIFNRFSHLFERYVNSSRVISSQQVLKNCIYCTFISTFFAELFRLNIFLHTVILHRTPF